MPLLSKPHFHDEAEAFAYLEGLLWPNGPVCPHCGATDRIYPLQGKTHRMGLKKCGHCREQFTVKVGTVMESSHVPLHKWLQAMHLLCCSKKGISSHQLHRLLGVTYKTAWFMAHRIREAMRDGSLGPLGGFGYAVEADETFIGKKEGVEKPKGGFSHKHAMLALVERSGKARSVHLDTLTGEEVGRVVRENLDRESWLMTKRGMKGVYQHCAEKHLHRYLAELDPVQPPRGVGHRRRRACRAGIGRYRRQGVDLSAVWLSLLPGDRKVVRAGSGRMGPLHVGRER